MEKFSWYPINLFKRNLLTRFQFATSSDKLYNILIQYSHACTRKFYLFQNPYFKTPKTSVLHGNPELPT